MAKSFAAAVGEWASKTDARLTATRRRAVELLAFPNRQSGSLAFGLNAGNAKD